MVVVIATHLTCCGSDGVVVAVVVEVVAVGGSDDVDWTLPPPLGWSF